MRFLILARSLGAFQRTLGQTPGDSIFRIPACFGGIQSVVGYTSSNGYVLSPQRCGGVFLSRQESNQSGCPSASCRGRRFGSTVLENAPVKRLHDDSDGEPEPEQLLDFVMLMHYAGSPAFDSLCKGYDQLDLIMDSRSSQRFKRRRMTSADTECACRVFGRDFHECGGYPCCLGAKDDGV
jgi:hypothetical protein